MATEVETITVPGIRCATCRKLYMVLRHADRIGEQFTESQLSEFIGRPGCDIYFFLDKLQRLGYITREPQTLNITITQKEKAQ